MIPQTLGTLAVLAVISEFLTEMIKDNIPFIQKISARWIAAAVGITICFLTDTGLLALSGGYSRYPYLDYFITGLIISRGSGVIHDLISALQGFARRQSAPPRPP